MLTPEQLRQIAEHSTVRALYDQVQEDIIADMARRMGRMNWAESYTTAWQLQKLEALNAERDFIVQKLAEYTGRTADEVTAILNTGCSTALGTDDRIYTLAGYNPIPLAQDTALQDVISAGLKKTLGTFENLTRTTANTASRQFENALDRAYMQVVSGGMSYQQAIKGAIIDLSGAGIAAIDYGTRVDSLDVAVRRAVLTGVNQTAAEVQLARAVEMECDLVEVSAHMGARPTHEEWQGRVYSISGNDTHYKSFVDSTGYGTGDGLCGWNCRHSFFPYFRGLSRQNYSWQELQKMKKQTVTYNGREISYYEATQMQRAGERDIRALKREKAGLEASGTASKEDIKAANDRLREAQARQRDFCEQTGLHRDYFRERAGKQDRQQSPNRAILKTAQSIGESTVAPGGAVELAQMEAGSLPSWMHSTAKQKKNSAAFAAWVNSHDGADPKMRAIYAHMGQLDNLPAASVTYSHGRGCVSTRWRPYNGEIVSAKVTIPPMDVPGDVSGSGHTTAHELGHLVDLLCRKDPALGTDARTAVDKDLRLAILGKAHAVPDEFAALFKATDAAAQQAGRTAWRDISREITDTCTQMLAASRESSTKYNELKKRYNELKRLEKVAGDTAMRNVENGVNNLEDIYDALTGGKRPGIFGHGVKYYYSADNRASEIWANYCDLSLSRPDLIEKLRKYEPDLVSALDAIRDDIFGRLTQ